MTSAVFTERKYCDTEQGHVQVADEERLIAEAKARLPAEPSATDPSLCRIGEQCSLLIHTGFEHSFRDSNPGNQRNSHSSIKLLGALCIDSACHLAAYDLTLRVLAECVRSTVVSVSGGCCSC